MTQKTLLVWDTSFFYKLEIFKQIHLLSHKNDTKVADDLFRSISQKWPREMALDKTLSSRVE